MSPAIPWPTAPRTRLPTLRERREGIGLRINGVDFETSLQFFEDEGLLNADQRQFDIRKRLDVLQCAIFRVDACPMFSFDFRLPTHSELDLPLSSNLTAILSSGQCRFGRTRSKLRHRSRERIPPHLVGLRPGVFDRYRPRCAEAVNSDRAVISKRPLRSWGTRSPRRLQRQRRRDRRMRSSTVEDREL